MPVKSKKPIRQRAIKDYTKTRGLSDHGPSKTIQKQEACQTTGHQRLYKNKRPIRPRTIKDYTRTRGLSDHRPSKVIQEQEAIRSRTINDCTRTIRSKTIKESKNMKSRPSKTMQEKRPTDQRPSKIIQEQRSIRPRTIKGYTRTRTLRSSLQETGLN